jgi:outer membrane protein assembly factor BamB
MPNGVAQRGCDSSPGLSAAGGLPWVTETKSDSTPTGLRPRWRAGATPLGLRNRQWHRAPRVGRGRGLPWAGGRNPFGVIGRLHLVTRWTAIIVSLVFCTAAHAGDWRQFRGNDCNGVAEATNLPTQWSETDNVAWKVELPGKGPSSPIVVAGHVIVTSSSGARQDRLHVLSYSAATGRLEWERQFWATGRTLCQPMTAVAAPTPASDGERIFALFSSSDLACLDLYGNLLWYRGLQIEHPSAGNDVGMASSPVVVGQTVIVQIESQGDSFAAGFDAESGDTRWLIERPRLGNWSSPTVVRRKNSGDDLVLLQSTTEISLHDPLTGQERWSHKLACNDITSTAIDGDKLFVPANGIHALQFQTAGKEPHSIWSAPKLNFGASSPIAHDGRIYTINRSGVLNCGDAATGDVLGQLRLKGQIWGSPALVGDRLYVVSRDGLGQVVQVGAKPEVIGEGAIGEEVLSSPAVADGALYVRAAQHLWKIADHDGRH